VIQKIQSVNLDANESVFFARELEHIKAQSYDVKYPEYKATRLIPVSGDAGPGARTITYRQFDSVGVMKIIADYATDLPRSDVKGKEFTSPVRSLGGSYGYSIQEIREAQMANRPLEQRRANAVRRANEQAVNRIAWLAKTDDGTNGGLQGLLYNPNVTSGAATTGDWATATPAEILADMNKAVRDMLVLTKGVEVPDTVLLPVDQFAQIQQTRLDSGTDTTIMEFFLKNNPSITSIEWVNELAGLNPKPSGAASATDVMVLYRRSPDVLTLEIPQDYEQFPAQEKGLAFMVPAHSRIGGVIVYYPLAISIVEDI